MKVCNSGVMTARRKVNTRLASFVPEDFFGEQPTKTADLPDPKPMIVNLARSVLEVLAGCRDLDQIARWLSDEVYRTLLTRVNISQRARAAKKQTVRRPTFGLGNVHISHPRDGAVEAVVIVHGKARSRSVAIRLEGLDGKWKSTGLYVL